MEVSVTFRHVEPTAALKDYATEKVERICSKYLRFPLEASVILSVGKQQHMAEINVHAKHFDISAHETTGDLYSSIDLALDKLDLGTYGSCETCHRTIDVDRLEAFPEARFCGDHEPALDIRSH